MGNIFFCISIKTMKLSVLFLTATLVKSADREADRLRREARDSREFNSEQEAKEFLKWRQEKYEWERSEERRDHEYERAEDLREYKKYDDRGSRDKDRRYESRSERFERYEDDREYERRRNRDL